MGDSDIRRWFLKQPHRKDTNETTTTTPTEKKATELQKIPAPDARSDLKKSSKYFSGSKAKPGSDDDDHQLSSAGKRKQQSSPPPPKHKEPSFPSPKKARIQKESAPAHKPSTPSASANTLDGDDFEDVAPFPSSPSPARGRGRGRGRGRAGASSSPQKDEKPTPAGRGRGGGGRGGASFYQPRVPPPHQGEKDIPEGADDCLAGSTFVISGTLDSLEREEAEDLIKRHGGRITTSISKKTSYLLADEDIGGRKSQRAKELGVPFLTEDGLLEMIRSSKPSKVPPKQEENISNAKHSQRPRVQPAKASPALSATKNFAGTSSDEQTFSAVRGAKLGTKVETEAWPQKYRPKNIGEIIGNQAIVKQLHDWLQHWFGRNLKAKPQKGQKHPGDSSSNSKKAVLLSGPPGIGKTTSARVISKLLGFEAFEVNASDNRGKADTKVGKGISGSTANAIKEMVSNESIALGANNDKHKKALLIMDEVDGMSGGDRGGVADLIASIKVSKIPVICICNDRYSQKLKSLANHCLPLNFRKPTKQQMAKRLQQVSHAEGMNVDEIALEELAERVNGDMRMALNQLQYMSLRMRSIKFDDVKARLSASAKDEDMSPFSAVDKLMSFDGGRLRMDARLDASMSDLDLVPLLVQENYLNYCPALAGRDESGTSRMDLIARSAACIADGDIVNVQIRQYRQWQHSQMAAFMSSIIPAHLMHGRREILTQGERNFNRFTSWLGKNSSYGKKLRLLDDIHVHMLASHACEPTRQAIRKDYLNLLSLSVTVPLKDMPKEVGVKTVADFMEEYSLTQNDIESIFDLMKFQGQPDPMAGVPPAVKAALTKAYRQRESERRVRSSDLLPVFTQAGQKKMPKKRTMLQISPDPLSENELEDDAESQHSDEEDESNGADLAALGANGKLRLNLEETNAKTGKQGKGSTAKKRPTMKEVNAKPPSKRRKDK